MAESSSHSIGAIPSCSRSKSRPSAGAPTSGPGPDGSGGRACRSSVRRAGRVWPRWPRLRSHPRRPSATPRLSGNRPLSAAVPGHDAVLEELTDLAFGGCLRVSATCASQEIRVAGVATRAFPLPQPGERLAVEELLGLGQRQGTGQRFAGTWEGGSSGPLSSPAAALQCPPKSRRAARPPRWGHIAGRTGRSGSGSRMPVVAHIHRTSPPPPRPPFPRHLSEMISVNGKEPRKNKLSNFGLRNYAASTILAACKTQPPLSVSGRSTWAVSCDGRADTQTVGSY